MLLLISIYGASVYSGISDVEKVKSSAKQDKLGETIAKILDTEKEIDRIISWEPGHPLIGGFASGLIDRDFAESLNDPIVITEDDSQEDKEKKQRMIEVKRQLLEAVNRGESVDAILEEARKELRSLATYRNNLAKELRELKKGGATEQEIEDFYAAANTMLKEKNIKPMLSPLKIKEKILAVQAERLDK